MYVGVYVSMYVMLCVCPLGSVCVPWCVNLHTSGHLCRFVCLCTHICLRTLRCVSVCACVPAEVYLCSGLCELSTG